MSKIIELSVECPDCKATGIYVGMGERNGFGVVCHKCDGTGRYEYKYEYVEFVAIKPRTDIVRVIQVNPGIYCGIAEDGRFVAESFGGQSYNEWKAGMPFPPKSEMRQFTCPAWWYQYTDSSKKPEWSECLHCRSFSECRNFPNKAACWDKWDKENNPAQ